MNPNDYISWHTLDENVTESATGVDGRPKEGRSNLRSQGGAGPRNAERKENAAAEAVGSHGGGGGRKMTSRPNVFFIMIDDMGWNDIGYQSTDLYQLTPNLDKLASDGIKVLFEGNHKGHSLDAWWIISRIYLGEYYVVWYDGVCSG